MKIEIVEVKLILTLEEARLICSILGGTSLGHRKMHVVGYTDEKEMLFTEVYDKLSDALKED